MKRIGIHIIVVLLGFLNSYGQTCENISNIDIDVKTSGTPATVAGNSTNALGVRICRSNDACSNKFKVMFTVPTEVSNFYYSPAQSSNDITIALIANPVGVNIPPGKKMYTFLFTDASIFEKHKTFVYDFYYSLATPRTCASSLFTLQAEMVYVDAAGADLVNATCPKPTFSYPGVPIKLPDEVRIAAVNFSAPIAYTQNNNNKPIYFDVVVDKNYHDRSLYKTLSYSINLNSTDYEVTSVTGIQNPNSSTYNSTQNFFSVSTYSFLQDGGLLTFTDASVENRTTEYFGYRVFLKITNPNKTSYQVKPSITVSYTADAGCTLPNIPVYNSSGRNYTFENNTLAIKNQPFIINQSPSTCINRCSVTIPSYIGQIDNNYSKTEYTNFEMEIPFSKAISIRTISFPASGSNPSIIVNPIGIQFKSCVANSDWVDFQNYATGTSINFATNPQLQNTTVHSIKLIFSSFPKKAVCNFMLEFNTTGASCSLQTVDQPFFDPPFRAISVPSGTLSTMVLNQSNSDCFVYNYQTAGYKIPTAITSPLNTSQTTFSPNDFFYSYFRLANASNAAIESEVTSKFTLFTDYYGSVKSNLITSANDLLFYYGPSTNPRLEEYSNLAAFKQLSNNATPKLGFEDLTVDATNINSGSVDIYNFKLNDNCTTTNHFVVLVKCQVKPKGSAGSHWNEIISSFIGNRSINSWTIQSSGSTSLGKDAKVACDGATTTFANGTLKPSDNFFYNLDILNSSNNSYTELKFLATLPFQNDKLLRGDGTTSSRNSTLDVIPVCNQITLQEVSEDGTESPVEAAYYKVYFLNNSNGSIIDFPTMIVDPNNGCSTSSKQAIYVATNGYTLPAYTSLRLKIGAQVPASSIGKVGNINFISQGKNVFQSTVSQIQISEVASFTVGTKSSCDPPPPSTCKECISSFYPAAGQYYLLSVWVKEGESQGLQTSYANAAFELNFKRAGLADSTTGPILATGEIIDGWQKVEKFFKVPTTATSVDISMKNLSSTSNVYFDDLRVHPLRANMKSFVYDPITLKLMAELDENNYATLYEYDHEGDLVRVKKETERGIVTIQEARDNSSKLTKIQIGK